MAMLIGLAEARGGSISSEGQKTYNAGLAKFDMRDIQTAIAEIAMEPRKVRKVGEAEWRDPAIPELGELIERVKAAEKKRTNPPYEPCQLCRDGEQGHFNGLVGRRDGSRTWFEECDCLREHKRRKAQLQGAAPIEDRKSKASGE